MRSVLENRFVEIEQLSRKLGLDFFDVVFEEVPREVIWDVASYGLPTRMSHWSFGRSFLHQKTYGEMGLSKIYELVINNDPAYAFLDDTNPDVTNLLIAAHVFAHADFFKNNQYFSGTNRNMVNQAEMNAKTIDSYREKYGIDEVEKWMDIAFSIDRHIDNSLGENREKYPLPKHTFKKIEPLPFADLFEEEEKPHVVEEIKNEVLPPHPEKDLIWFLTNYGKMLPWQRDIFEIIRSEAFYFYPQGQTKITNEGWASFWHAEIMYHYDNLSADEHMQFSKSHSSVVSKGSPGQVNPYYMGFRIFTDIKKRWDDAFEEGKKDNAFQKLPTVDMYDEDGKLVASKMTGLQKIMKVRREETDYGFICNYLTRELATDMELFTYGLAGVWPKEEDDNIILKSRKLERIKARLTAGLHNNGVPFITIDKVENNVLWLVHSEHKMLDQRYAKETVKYIGLAWGGQVNLRTYKGSEPITISITPDGNDIKVGETKKIKIDI